MTQTYAISNDQRLRIAGLAAGAGLLTACAMTLFGASPLHYLPQTGFHLAAFLGAGSAGFVVADGFGRPGVRGLVRAALSAGVSTVLGAGLGAMYLVGPFEDMGAAALGAVVVADALLSGTITLKAWTVSMILLHLMAGRIRAAD